MVELPEWLPIKELRPPQERAIEQILDAYARGVQVVVLNGPTGSGKTVIAEGTRAALGNLRGTYTASTLDLQDQFARDFRYARVLKGKGNYPTAYRPDLTAADCTGKDCDLCPSRDACGYQKARVQAIKAPVVVVNSALLLASQNPAFFREFVVLDEADTIEAALLRHYEYFVPAVTMQKMGLQPPVKGARVKTICEWLGEQWIPRLQADLKYLEELGSGDVTVANRKHRLKEMIRGGVRLRDQLAAGDVPWIREYMGDRDHFIYTPVEVSSQGAEVLWGRGRSNGKWLAMSGTIIDAEEWCRSTGVIAAGLRWEAVDVPNTWDKANRPIVVATVGDMSRSGTAEEQQAVVDKVVDICRTHADENCLVHTVNYALMTRVAAALRAAGIYPTTYANSKEREFALGRFRKQGGVLVAPSLDRGIDLPDELCRVVVVAKMPFMNLGDRRVSERLHMPDGNVWYQVQTARSLVQMTGRGVRHKDDRCVMYVLDKAFDKFYGKWARLLPKWWRDAMVGELPDDWWTRGT